MYIVHHHLLVMCCIPFRKGGLQAKFHGLKLAEVFAFSGSGDN